MALSANHEVTSADITALKNRVKAEMARRKYSSNGPSLASYKGDFSVGAGSGDITKAAHYNETVGYISKIKAISGLAASVAAGDIMYAIQAASTRLATDEAKGVHDNSTTCSSGCTGLCYTTCSGGCRSGCTGGCSSGCSGCSNCGGCDWGCSNGCIDHCTNPNGNCSFSWGATENK